MGCGSSSHPVAGSSDEGLDNDVNDPNKQTKSVVRNNNTNQHGIIQAVQNVDEGERQDKHVLSHAQDQLDIIAKTPDQTEQVKLSEGELASKLRNNKTIIAATTKQANENDKDSNTEEVRQVSGSRHLMINSKDTATVETAQNEFGDSISNRNDSCSSTNLERKATDETDLLLTQGIATPSEQDVGENEKTSAVGTTENVQEFTVKNTSQSDSDLNVMHATATSPDQDIAVHEKPSTDKKTEEKQKERNGAATIAFNAAEITAEKCNSLNSEFQVPENQFDSVNEVSEPPSPSDNSKQSVNMEMDSSKFSQENSSVDIEVLTTDDLEQTDNFNQEKGTLQQKSTEDTVVELQNEISSDEYEQRLNCETALPQFGCTSNEPLMEESNVQTTVQENNSESVLSCDGPLQQENSSDNQSTVTGPCEDESQPQLKDSGSLSAVCEVKKSATDPIESVPSRDTDAENRLITALRLSCKLSPGNLVKDLDFKGVMSVHLLRSLSPGVVTVAELVHKLLYLTELDLSGNLLGPQGFRVICLALRRNTTLKCLNLANNLADTDSSECIGKMLSANNTLERLDVSGNNLGSDYFSRCIGPALRENQCLKTLKFSSCGSSDVSAICEALVEGNSTIEELDASSNQVGAVFGQGLSNILQQLVCSLRYLDVHGTNLGKEGMETLLAGIRQNSSLVSLNAAGHQVSYLSVLLEFLYSCICHPTLEELILENTKALELDEWKPTGLSLTKGNSNLAKVLLSGCSLTNQTLRTVSEKTQGKLPCLSSLDLSSNEQLTPECLSSICAMTSSPGQSFSLSVLDFSLNSADGIVGDIEKLPELKNLKTFVLKKCRITPESVVGLSKLITLTTLDFWRISSVTLDGIKLSGTDALKGMLGLSDMFIPTNPCNLELLSLIGCGLNDRDVKPLMNGIGNGLVINELRLSANRLTDTAVNYLVDSSGTLLPLQVLDLSINKIRNGGAEKLAGALSDKLANLKSLLLADNCIGKTGIQALVGKVGPASQLGVLNLKSQQQPLIEEDMDQITEQLAKSLGFDPKNSESFAPNLSLTANFTINLTGLGGEPGELGPKLDSQAVLTDYSSKHRRTLTFQDALQLSAVLSQSENTRASMSQSDWDRVINADKDAPAWLQLSSKRECAVYVSNLPLSVTAEKLEGQLDSEAECNVVEVYLLKDQILRKPNGLAWVLFTDYASVQRAVDYYNSGQAFMYGTPFVISTLDVDVMADTGSEENSEAKARQEMIQRAEGRKADQTAHAQLVQMNYNESLARHEYAAQHPAYADGRVW